ncbi:uncharacterized protein GLRG_11675 [Colletotrichum graminicola M1.001]|uniref:Short chain dehydrogenase n=1 Tax=Colletotrichum graminicola (strain M1.001 / M2 / FGSC 10212) TaxID=645133 RepID=E3R0A2_COLGM|nr:uncharacterized protein GLRG_11675 [Colletotrichum graminicola M1.001]EFQ36540.1 hypothetical protein GLRG_11675 [Colletotrichum graminicola M1.001]
MIPHPKPSPSRAPATSSLPRAQTGAAWTSSKDVEGLAKRVAEKFDAVDLLINNARFLSTWAPLAETDLNEWWTKWEVNIKGIIAIILKILS